MKKLKFKDKDGNIHEFENVKLFTGALDRYGKEIWEGDTIRTPCHVGYDKRHRILYEINQVIVDEGFKHGPTGIGQDIWEVMKFRAKTITPPNTKQRYSYSWSKFFDCEVINENHS